MVLLENIDIDKAILQNIDIDKISNRFKFGISNRATWKRVGSGSRRLKAFRLKRRGEDGGAVSPSPRKTTHLENVTWRGFGRTASHLDTNQSNCGSRAGAPAGPQASKV